jgi:hypothetical protein
MPGHSAHEPARDDELWLVGEYYERRRPLSHHIRQLPRDVCWHADPAGTGERNEMRCVGFSVINGVNALRPGISGGDGTSRKRRPARIGIRPLRPRRSLGSNSSRLASGASLAGSTTKKRAGRGRSQAWAIFPDEVLRIHREGILPLRKMRY